MVSIIVITGLGIFAVGVVVGIIVMVSHGIRREQRRYEEARRFREEHGIWGDPDVPGNFLPEQAPDGVSLAARRFNGLYVRHLPTVRRYDAELALRA